MAVAAAVAMAVGAFGCSADDDTTSETDAPCAAVGGLAVESPRTSGARTPPLDLPDTGAPLRVLVLTETDGFFHDSIPTLTEWFEELTDDGELDATVTDDSEGLFTGSALAEVDVVVFGNTTHDVLDDDEQVAFQGWVEGGGGFVGIHSAADTEHDWEWFGEMVGASFDSHPLLFQNVELSVEDPEHPAVAHLPDTFDYVEEFYNYDRHPRDTAEVLVSLEEDGATRSYDGQPVGDEFTHGYDHPVAWTKQMGLGRVFYTNLGHRIETWQDPDFQSHVLEGIRWTVDGGRWRHTVVADDLGQAVALRVAPSGHVLWIERDGLVGLYDPGEATLRTVGRVPTEVVGEGGLIGIELAPDVATSGHVYLYFTRPATGTDTEYENVLARFTLDADCTFDVEASEELLVVPNDGPSHQGGDLRFHPDGTLLVATGDNTENVDDGGAPIDQRPDHETENAFRTSGDPTDLRGAILRVEPDGSPAEGNLASTGVDAAPEVFVTGVRNPYRLTVDPSDGSVWWGEIGPDAAGDLDRGPRGYDELNRVEGPADGGWPRCVGDFAYHRFDAATGEIGDRYSCEGTARPLLSYDYATVTDIDLGNALRSGLGGSEAVPLGRALMAGPVLSPEAGDLASPDEGLLLHEFARSKLLIASPSADGRFLDLDQFVPWMTTNSPIDVEMGPDGVLYVLDYGGFAFTEGAGVPRIQRIEYRDDGSFPVVGEGRWVTDESAPVGDASPSAIYQLQCAGCHGIDGRGGTGPSYEGISARLDRDEMLDVVRDGRGRMPSFGAQLSDAERDAVVDYVRDEFG